MTVIPVLSRNTVTSLAHCGTVPHRRLDFFYSNTNNYVQLENTTIKTERCCSMQHTERTRVFHHSSLGLHCRGCPDHISCALGINFPNTMVMVGNSGAIWMGGLTLSRSQTSFQNSISALYSYRAPVQPALGPVSARCSHEPVLRFICGDCAQHVQRCSEQASRYNIWVTEQNKFTYLTGVLEPLNGCFSLKLRQNLQ